MPAIFQTEANKLLDASLDGVAYAATQTYLALLTAAASVSAAGTEVANANGSGYARQLVAWATAASGAKSNSSALTYSNMPPATVVGVQAMSAATGGNPKWFGPLGTARTTAAGDSLQIAAGQLAASLA